MSTPTISTPGFITIPSNAIVVGDIIKLSGDGKSFLVKDIATKDDVIIFMIDPAPGYKGLSGWLVESRVGERGFLVDSVQHEEVLGVKF